MKTPRNVGAYSLSQPSNKLMSLVSSGSLVTHLNASSCAGKFPIHRAQSNYRIHFMYKIN